MGINPVLSWFSQYTNSNSRLRPFFGSIRFRLLLWGEAILLLVLVAFSGIVYYRQVAYQRSLVENTIAPEAKFILDAYRKWYLETNGQDGLSFSQVFRELQESGLQQSPGQSNQITPSKQVIPENSVIQSEEVLLMITQDGRVIGQAGYLDETDVTTLSQLAVEVDSKTADTFFFTFSLMYPGYGWAPMDYLFVQSDVILEPGTKGPLSSNQRAILLLGAPLDPNGQLPGLAWTLIMASLIILGFSLVGSYWLAGRLMQPIQAITSTVQEIKAHDLTRRLNLNKQDELGELADTFDQMLDRLEDAFRQQRQFAADASHDLRTPLTIINLEVNHILEGQITQPELQKSLEVIRDENERMTHLVNKLLVLSRADAGNARLTPQIVDLSEITLDVVERLIPLSQRNEMEIHTGEMPPVMIRGDRFYLNQMATNLVENAIKHGRGADYKIWIETGHREDNGSPSGSRRSHGWLRVEDHGPGIPEEHLPHLFDRFYRVDPSRAAAPGENDAGNGDLAAPSDGHGLGLSIVQWVARAHGGEVRVTSQVGRGAIFEVVLPLAEDDSGRIGSP